MSDEPATTSGVRHVSRRLLGAGSSAELAGLRDEVHELRAAIERVQRSLNEVALRQDRFTEQTEHELSALRNAAAEQADHIDTLLSRTSDTDAT